MREGTYPIVLDIDKTRSIATESSFESSELSTPCSIASQSTTEFSMQYSSYPENETDTDLNTHSGSLRNVLDSSKYFINTSQIPARPPLNFGTVMDGNVYRSSYPLPENFEMLSSLKLRTILTLVPQPIPDAYAQFVKQENIDHIQLSVPANKEQVRITQVIIGAALSVALDPSAYPLLIHCNKGKHRTGCLVACVRRWHGAPAGDAIAEYRAFAYPKARPLDELFIESFDRDALLQFAQENPVVGNDYVKDQPDVSFDTMATGGKLDKTSLDELRSITASRSASSWQKLLNF